MIMWRETPDYLGDKDAAEHLATIIRDRYRNSSRGVKVWTEKMTMDKQVMWVVRSNIEFLTPARDSRS